MKKITFLLFCFVLISCLKEPKSENNAESVENNFTTTKTLETIDNNTYKKENQKKYVYIKVKISKPILRGNKSEFYDLPSTCYVDYEDNDFLTDIIELDYYDENVKYKLLDDTEKIVMDKFKYLSLYGDAVVEYGYKAAENIKNSSYSTKIIQSDIFVFDSYADASKNKRL